ncbi:High-affinity fructose transporter ght6-like protein [Elsinoe fawcettii]|nr:High-affinity fructose transporter ght6-like protein [Elsinoe fawcettii]
MNIISRFQKRFSSTETTPRNSIDNPHAHKTVGHGSHKVDPGYGDKDTDEPIRILRLRILAMVLIVSLGGLIFGYDTGQISGFLEMEDFLTRFSDTAEEGKPAFSNVRSGTIVGLLSIGTLMGAIIAAPIADKFGRRISIVWWNIVFCIGVIVQITTSTRWYDIAIGRWVAGLGVGGLSVLTPMYQSETAPRQIRGALVSCYQLFITLGIFIAYCINFGTEARTNSSSWRIPMGVGFVFPAVMAIGICFLRESPRWDYRHGKIERATTTVAKSYGVPETHWEVRREMREIKAKLDAENVGGAHPWYEVFTGPRMAYRTGLGIALQALQQLTGANYFFYYGTTIFTATGIDNSYVTSMILGGINFGTTFLALYVVEHFGRRKSLMTGGSAMFVCFMIFASVGHFSLDQETPQNTPTAGTVMIVFAALFIFAYAATWGPIIWCITGEIYPSRYRAKAMGLSTASNWTWNFLISFFTPFITAKIDFRYGYVFAACNLLGVFVTYFFVCESQGRSLEETDTMYIMHVKPWESSKWTPPEGEDLVTADNLNLTSGARGIRKEGNNEQRHESVGGVLGNEHDPEKANMSGAQ